MHRNGAEKDNVAPPSCNIASPIQSPPPTFPWLVVQYITVLYYKAGWGPQKRGHNCNGNTRSKGQLDFDSRRMKVNWRLEIEENLLVHG